MSATSQPTKTATPPNGGRALIAVLTLLIIFACAIGGLWAAPAHATPGVSYSEDELQFYALLNAYRVANGVSPLLLSDTLSLSGDRHSSDMGKYKFFDHRTIKSDWFPKGYWPWDRMKACGYNYYTNMGENIAAGQVNAEDVFAGFRQSAGHNALMLSSAYKVVGISLVLVPGSPYYTYWTVDFGGVVDPTAHDPEVFQQSDSRVAYLGSWISVSSSYASGGSLAYAESQGAAALLSFEGIHAELRAKTGPDMGIAWVSLDGGARREVDLYSATAASQQPVYDTGDPLEDKTHTLLVQWANDKNPSSSGTVINLDAIKVVDSTGEFGTLVQPPPPFTHEQCEATITYVGPWSTGSTASASGRSFSFANAPGSAVNVQFRGTYLAWLAKKSPAYGKAQVSLDGGAPVTVDLYSSYAKYKQNVYNTGLLEYGDHTLSIYWTGQKYWAATGYNIDVDAFYAFGGAFDCDCSLSNAADPAPITWLYQNTDSRLAYLGPWTPRSIASASGGNYYYTSLKGAAVSVNFKGTGIEVLAKKGPAYSEVNISLDGAEPVKVDLHAATDLFKQSVYTNPAPLTYGKHTLTMEYLGRSETTGGWAGDIDAFRITGTMTPAAGATRFQQTDPMFSFEQSWATSATSNASGGSLRYAASPGAKVTISFNGTFFAWLAKTSPLYGLALVTVDNDPSTATTVDLYSATTLYKRQVFATGVLASGPHTVTIEWTGNKNPASLGTYVNIDAADILAVAP